MTASQARPYLWLKMEGITSLKRLKLSLFEMFFVLNDCDVRCVGNPNGSTARHHEYISHRAAKAGAVFPEDLAEMCREQGGFHMECEGSEDMSIQNPQGMVRSWRRIPIFHGEIQACRLLALRSYRCGPSRNSTTN